MTHGSLPRDDRRVGKTDEPERSFTDAATQVILPWIGRSEHGIKLRRLGTLGEGELPEETTRPLRAGRGVPAATLDPDEATR
jgi:hypothetical protein